MVQGIGARTVDGVDRVLLIHGAWHGAWCWEPLIEPLRAQGVEVETIDLPGHGDSTDPLGDLHGDADAVRARLDTDSGPVLLVGHSYGGMVITDAGVHDAVAGLVYVCAFMPSEERSLMETTAAMTPPDGAAASELLACLSATEDGLEFRLEGDGVVNALYGDCDPETQRRSIERLGAQPTASFSQAPRSLAWRSKPSTYVVCSQDRTIPAWEQREMARNADRVVEMDASHSPFLSVPDELAECIADAARALA